MKRRIVKEYAVIWSDGTRWTGDDPAWHEQNRAAVRNPNAPAVRTEVRTYVVYR